MPTPKTWLRKLRVTRVDFVPRGDNPGAHIAFAKTADDDLTEDSTVPHEALKDLTDAQVDAIGVYVKALADEHAAAAVFLDAHREEAQRFAAEKAAFEKAVREADPNAPVLIDKAALAPEVREAIEKAEAAAAQATAKAEAVEKRERERIFKERANALPRIGSADEVAPLLHAVADAVDADTYEKVERILVAADERIAKGDLFKEIGSGGAGAGGDVVGKVNAAAAEMRKAHPDLSAADATLAVLEASPDLYADYRKALAEQ